MNSMRSIVISTLTKKFYFTESQVRDRNLDISENQSRMQETLQDLNRKVSNVVDSRGAPSPNASNTKKTRSAPVKRASSFQANGMTTTDSPRKPTTSTKANAVLKKQTSLADRPPWKY